MVIAAVGSKLEGLTTGQRSLAADLMQTSHAEAPVPGRRAAVHGNPAEGLEGMSTCVAMASAAVSG
jgi:hypothetical protein